MKYLVTLIALLIASVATAEKPNVLFVFADDLSYETLGHVGKTEVKTPHLDKLVSQGASYVTVSPHLPHVQCRMPAYRSTSPVRRAKPGQNPPPQCPHGWCVIAHAWNGLAGAESVGLGWE